MAKSEKETVPAESAAIAFSKSKLLTFGRYAKRVDLLNALLEDDREYTAAEVDSLIKDFMKGRMK